MELLDDLGRLALAAGGGPAVYAVVALAAALDPILLAIPAETILISAAVLSAHRGGPLIWLLVLIGAAGARSRATTSCTGSAA